MTNLSEIRRRAHAQYLIPKTSGGLPAVAATRSFSRRFISVLGGLILLYLLFAIVVDPRRDFGTGIFPVVSLDSRGDKMRLFDQYNQRKAVEGIVVGSSRSMMLGCDELDAKTRWRWFNFSVDSARAEDYLAIYRWAKSKDSRITALVVGLDVEALHDRIDFDGRLKANPGLMGALGGGKPSAYRKTTDFLAMMKTVFSRYYLHDEFRSLLVALRPRPAFSAFGEDGVLRYVQWDGERAAGRFDLQKNIKESREEYVRRLDHMQGLSAKRKNQIESLVKEAQRDKVQVVLWITPVHPEVAKFLARETAYVTRLEETRSFVEQLRTEFTIPVFDLSNSAAFDGTDSGWYDGGHIDQENAERVINRLVTALR